MQAIRSVASPGSSGTASAARRWGALAALAVVLSGGWSSPVAADDATLAAADLYEYEVDSSLAAPCPPGAQAAPAKPNPCATSHKPLFYDNDFSYLDDCDYHGCCFADGLKRLAVGPCGVLDIGGQYRLRYHHEVGMKGPQRFLNTHDDFVLNRVRLFADYESNSWWRGYVEGIFADSTGQRFPARPIDRNHGDLLNAFIDARVADDVTLRVGRQELLLGAQRLVSPLDWSNTRRTFDGARLMLASDDWALDLFYTQPVHVDPFEFDRAAANQHFYGAYATRTGLPIGQVELYYLGFDNHRDMSSLHTLGGRLNGSQDDWLWEVEGAGQFGDAAGVGVRHEAAFLTLGLGRRFPDRCWKPTLWAYFDYATGDGSAPDEFNDFNHLFPLGHRYLGFIDALTRANLETPNVLLTLSPTEKTTLLLWYYYLRSNTRAPFTSLGGTPVQNDSREIGHELDVLLTHTLGPRLSILFGYSHFWAGPKIVDGRDADFFYTELTWNF